MKSKMQHKHIRIFTYTKWIVVKKILRLYQHLKKKCLSAAVLMINRVYLHYLYEWNRVLKPGVLLQVHLQIVNYTFFSQWKKTPLFGAYYSHLQNGLWTLYCIARVQYLHSNTCLQQWCYSYLYIIICREHGRTFQVVYSLSSVLTISIVFFCWICVYVLWNITSDAISLFILNVLL